MCVLLFFFFFFKQKTAYEISTRDWSSDVCSSDLPCAPSARRHSRAGRARLTLSAADATNPRNFRGLAAMQGMMSFAPILVMFGIFYFILIRPQVRKQKEHQAMLQKLGKGEEVITRGGLIGKITGAGDHLLALAQLLQ